MGKRKKKRNMSSYTNPNHPTGTGDSTQPESGLEQTRKQVDEVVGIMQNNVEKVLERDAKLNELDDRATTLQQGAEMFDRNAGKIQRKMWYQNMKMNFIIGGVVLVVVIIIIVVSTGGDDPNPTNPPNLVTSSIPAQD